MRTENVVVTPHIVRAGSVAHTGSVQSSIDPSLQQITPERLTEILPRICSKETSFSPDEWSPTNPLGGHCAIVSLVAQDLFGGETLRASLKHIPELSHIGSHYWNRFPNGAEIDFTRAQFGDNYPRDLKPEVKDRVYLFSNKRTEERYQLFLSRLKQFVNGGVGTEPSQSATFLREAALTARPNLIPTDSSTLLKKYGIDLNKVSITVNSKYITALDLDEITQRKEELITKLIEAHEHALKNKKLKGSMFSDRQYASNLEFELSCGNDKRRVWITAGNFEMNISELICGERGGITVGLNKALEMLPIELVNQLPENANIENMLKVRRLLMSSSKPIGEDKSAWQPCSDCYAWMGTNRFFSPETQIISFLKDEKSNLVLEVRTLKDLLPIETLKTTSMTDKEINSLNIEYSNDAKRVLATNPISERTIYEMLSEAKKEYYSGAQINKGFSGKNSAASVLFHESNEIFTARRVEWVPRWPEPPDLLAAKIGINKLTKEGIESPTVKAAAYFSDHTDEPSIKSNGRLAQKRGSKDIIVIVIENDAIQVRTILDYQPWIHGSVRKLSANRTTV